MPQTQICSVIYHQNDKYVAGPVAKISQSSIFEGNIGFVMNRTPFDVAPGVVGGTVADLVVNKISGPRRWSGKLVSVAPGVRKGQALAALNLERERTLYLALASLHRGWVEAIYPQGAPDVLTTTVVPPTSNGLWLNDFPYVFLVNDLKRDVYLSFYPSIMNRLLAALASSKSWAKPQREGRNGKKYFVIATT